MEYEEHIETVDDLLAMLPRNPGVIVIKVGATWCAPCRLCAPLVKAHCSRLNPAKTLALEVDVDESADFYSFMKSKRMLRGIPVIYAYFQGNTTYMPDEIVAGASASDIGAFFARVAARVAKDSEAPKN